MGAIIFKFDFPIHYLIKWWQGIKLKSLRLYEISLTLNISSIKLGLKLFKGGGGLWCFLKRCGLLRNKDWDHYNYKLFR